MSKTLMLAKTFDKNEVDDSLYFVSEKLDGMPVVIYGAGHGDKSYTAWTRQGKPVTSIPHILERMKKRDMLTRHISCMGTSDFVCGELYIPGRAHKDIRGLAVRHEPCTELELHVFPPFLVSEPGGCIKNIPNQIVTGHWLADGTYDPQCDFMHDTLGDPVEGYIAYKVGLEWVPGKRSPQYMKMLKQHTLDLRVTGLLEAVSKDGEKLGRVGAFICLWGDGITKVGAGKLTHKQATQLWETHQKGHELFHPIIEVRYKSDGSYEKPREPTFQNFRYDKDEYDLTFKETDKL